SPKPRRSGRASEPRAASPAQRPRPGQQTPRRWQMQVRSFSLRHLSFGLKDEGVSARPVPIFFSFPFNVLTSARRSGTNFGALPWGVTESSCTGCVRSSAGAGAALFHRARLDRRRYKMAQPSLLEDLSARISEFLAASPAKDLEKNLQALLTSAFSRLDLATREQFQVHAQSLSRAREQRAELERGVGGLETGVKEKWGRRGARGAPQRGRRGAQRPGGYGRGAPRERLALVHHRRPAGHRSEGERRARAGGARQLPL